MKKLNNLIVNKILIGIDVRVNIRNTIEKLNINITKLICKKCTIKKRIYK